MTMDEKHMETSAALRFCRRREEFGKKAEERKYGI